MVAYLCPLCASYFSFNYVDMQDKDVDMQDSYVNMQHNYADMQENCNQIRVIKNLKCRQHVTSKMLDTLPIDVNMQLIYVNMQLLYVDMQLIYVDMQLSYVNMQDKYVDM